MFFILELFSINIEVFIKRNNKNGVITVYDYQPGGNYC